MRKWGKWVAEVRQPNSRDRIWLGSYETEEEAARAYDAAVFCLRGPSVVLNFPDDPPEILSAGELSPSQIQVAASKHARRRGVAAADHDQVKEAEENMYMFGGTAGAVELGSSSFGGGGGDEAVGGGDGFFNTSRMWNF
ncbi:hypothetical protein RD792_010907 [Penstemon davidsonii]|uniref:AP2/ERF domain-containing protein n=1 Tax=Penstemon davidsonii TaxID=160366 RepID=A0ABR0D334_9LAMI|nr:hypothetical protein RD792_010907 [Penstemon davidsonii]